MNTVFRNHSNARSNAFRRQWRTDIRSRQRRQMGGGSAAGASVDGGVDFAGSEVIPIPRDQVPSLQNHRANRHPDIRMTQVITETSTIHSMIAIAQMSGRAVRYSWMI